MFLNYKLDENDFLLFTLYDFKKENLLKKAIIRDRLVWSRIMLVFSAVIYFDHGLKPALFILVFSAIGISFRPLKLKNSYFNRFRKQAEFCRSMFGDCELILNDDYIEVKYEDADIKRRLTVIRSITETRQHFFIFFSVGSIIIPKLNLNNLELVKSKLVFLAEYLKLEYISDLNWSW
ncbi:MAG: hypothetical protein ABI091_18965 [Ferruginibacter sp.]